MAEDYLITFLREDRVPLGSPVELSVWNGDLDACKAMADKYGIPMIAVWSNKGCTRCEILEKAFRSDAFHNWMKSCGMVLCFTCSEDPHGVNEQTESDRSRYKFFCKKSPTGTLSDFPFVRFYWYADNGQTRIVDYNVKGDTVDKQQGIYKNSYDKAGNICIDYIMNTAGFGAYVPKRIMPVTLSFNSNGGQGYIAPITVYLENDTSDYTVTLPTGGYTKSGYILDGWLINETKYMLGSEYELTSDITATAQWHEDIRTKKNTQDDNPIDWARPVSRITNPVKINITGTTVSYHNDQFPVYYAYKTNGMKTARMSNNVSAISYRGADPNGLDGQLISAYMHSNVTELMPSCFMNCSELTAVNADVNVKTIGDYAFANCTKLKSLPFLGPDNKSLVKTGDHAFAGSGLERIVLSLKSSVSDTSHGSYTFADCKNLTDVRLVGAPYLAYHMFDGCAKLSSVQLENKHSYVQGYCFANCTSLTSITLPANCYMLASHMFDGCTNLTRVDFQPDAILGYVEDHVFANCPNLTSITLPASVSSLEYIDPEFLAGSNVNRVVFQGLSDDVFADTKEHMKAFDYSLDTWYWKKEDISKIKKCADENNIPVFVGSGLAGCGNCEKIFDYETKETKTTRGTLSEIQPSSIDFSVKRTGKFNCKALAPYMNDAKYFRIFGLQNRITKTWSVVYDSCHETETRFNAEWGNAQPFAVFHWKKPDGTVINKTYNDTLGKNSNWWIARLNEHFAGYDKTTTEAYYTVTIKEQLTTFGRGANVTFVSSTGQEYVCSNNSIMKLPDYRVDRDTVDDFKYGIWYYNARELKSFADRYHIPVLAEWSSAGCEPCDDFRHNTWRNREFQNQIAARSCMFCRIEASQGENWDTPVDSQRYFISHKWGEPNALIPQLIYYWNKPSGEIYREIWNYNYRIDPAAANYQTVLQKLDTMIATYTPEDRLYPPAVVTSDNGWFRYYINERNDANGRYFVCDSKTSVSRYDGVLSIDIQEPGPMRPLDENGVVETVQASDPVTVLTGIYVGQEITSIPSYTYQYYGVDPTADSFYDRNGVIFKIDDQHYIGGKRVYPTFAGWIDDEGQTYPAETETAVKREVEYIYTFENYEYAEDVVPPDTNRYPVSKMLDLDDSVSEFGFTDIIDYSISDPSKIVIIFCLDTSSNSNSFETDIMQTAEFTSFVKCNEWIFVKVKSSAYSSGASKAVADFETRNQFKGEATSFPRILCFHGCRSCGDKDGLGYGIYCRHKIAVQSGRTVQYYMNEITRFANAYDDP